MEKINKYSIILDGKMDEPIWNTVPEYSGFTMFVTRGGQPQTDAETYFKVLPCEDRIYVGVKCMENDRMPHVVNNRYSHGAWAAPAIELYFSPAGTNFEAYQFYIGINEVNHAFYYGEGGNIQPDPYSPQWNTAVYMGEDYWSLEFEVPLTAFYMTPNARWSDKWLFNVGRTRCVYNAEGRYCGLDFSSWAPLNSRFLEIDHFRQMEGMPMRPVADDVFTSEVAADLTEIVDGGYKGELIVKTAVAEGGEFTLTSSYAETVTVKLDAGVNTVKAPCFFTELGRPWVDVKLTRVSDGTEYFRKYPVVVEYEPIRIKFTRPQYRTDFYPGQDYSKIVGTAKAAKPVTLTLEGPGIEKQTVTPDSDGNFTFQTPNFQEGDAWITATIDGYEKKQKVRRLAPTGHTMAWIEDGNLVVDGKPVLRRNYYGPHYRGGVAFNNRYDEEYEQGKTHETKEFARYYSLQPNDLVKGSERPGGEALLDKMPSDEMLARVDAVIEAHKNDDFTHYYISDEPDCRNLSPVFLKNLYQYITDKDPYHLILTASRGASKYIECADWFETHPYINAYVKEDGTRIYGRQMNTLGRFLDDVLKLNRPDKCMGFLPTCFSEKYTSKNSEYPNFAEIDCHTWAAMIRGGKSLWPYAYHDVNDRPALYEGFNYVFASFEALEELLLHAKRTTILESQKAEAALYELGNEKMFVLVNMIPEVQTVTLEGIEGTWHSFRRNATLTGNTFTLKPFEVLIGTTEIKDAGYPTYEETEALIDKLEYDRTHRGSVLFDRKWDMEITTSYTYNFYHYKVFDGMLDNWALQLSSKGEKFYEMNLTKFRPSFKKVMIHGDNVQSATLKVRNGGELADAPVASTETAQYSKTFYLAETISPDCLRIEFDFEGIIEIYEIEAFD